MSERQLTTVRDVYPSPESFNRAVDDVLALYADDTDVLLPTTLAVRLGVPEINIRREINDDGYGDAVERLYMSALDSCVRAIFLGKVSNAQAAIGVVKEMFSWFEGCLAFLKEDGMKAAERESSMNQAMRELYEELTNQTQLDCAGVTDGGVGKTDKVTIRNDPET